MNSSERVKLLSKAENLGITHFDTSPYYGYGLAEIELGKHLHTRRSLFTISTKFGLYPLAPHINGYMSMLVRKGFKYVIPSLSLPHKDWDVNKAKCSLRKSLIRLKTDYIDFLFLHEPEINYINLEVMLDWLKDEKKAGNIRYWGLAGNEENITPFLHTFSELAQVIQSKDSLNYKEAKYLATNNKKTQFTYGYFSNKFEKTFSSKYILENALKQNPGGSILISSRKIKHLEQIKNCKI